MTVSASFPVPHSSLIQLTDDGATQPAHVDQGQGQTADCVLERVARGDPGAARECVDRFGNLIWSIASHVTCTRADAEQAVQRIFADVWRSAGCFDPEQGSEEIFITMIARRQLLDRRRRAARRRPRRVINYIAALTWTDADNNSNLCAEALAATRAVMQLRPALRALLEIGILQGLNQLEIARELQLPIDKVKTVMRHALNQVRELMACTSRIV